MKWLLSALNRTSRDAVFSVGLVLCVLIIAAAPAAGASTDYPPAGFINTDTCEESGHISTALTGLGYIEFDDRQKLEDAILSGELDCGVVIEKGLSDRIRSGDCSGALTLLVSPSSTMPETYRLSAAACLYEIAAPYVSYEALEETQITREELVREYEEYTAEGHSFTFDIRTASVRREKVSARSVSVTLGAMSLVLFIAVMFSNLILCRSRLLGLTSAIGLKRTALYSFLPQILLRLLLTVFAATIGLISAKLFAFDFTVELIVPTVIYILLLYALTLLSAAVLPSEHTAAVAVVVLAIAGLALCPIYTDAALAYPALDIARMFVPMYWLWLCRESPAVMAAAAAVFVTAACSLLLLFTRKRGKYQ